MTRNRCPTFRSRHVSFFKRLAHGLSLPRAKRMPVIAGSLTRIKNGALCASGAHATARSSNLSAMYIERNLRYFSQNSQITSDIIAPDVYEFVLCSNSSQISHYPLRCENSLHRYYPILVFVTVTFTMTVHKRISSCKKKKKKKKSY